MKILIKTAFLTCITLITQHSFVDAQYKSKISTSKKIQTSSKSIDPNMLQVPVLNLGRNDMANAKISASKLSDNLSKVSSSPKMGKIPKNYRPSSGKLNRTLTAQKPWQSDAYLDFMNAHYDPYKQEITFFPKNKFSAELMYAKFRSKSGKRYIVQAKVTIKQNDLAVERGVTCERLQMTTGSYERFEKFDLRVGENIFEFLLNSNVNGWVQVPFLISSCAEGSSLPYHPAMSKNPQPGWRLNYIKVMEM